MRGDITLRGASQLNAYLYVVISYHSSPTHASH